MTTLSDLCMTLNLVKPIINSGDSKRPQLVTILSRITAVSRWGTEIVQYMKEPYIVLQVSQDSTSIVNHRRSLNRN